MFKNECVSPPRWSKWSKARRKLGPPPSTKTLALEAPPQTHTTRSSYDCDGHLLWKQPNVCFVTSEGASDRHFFTQGRLPAPQGHLGTAHWNVLAQSASVKQVATSHFEVAHSHCSLHAALSHRLLAAGCDWGQLVWKQPKVSCVTFDGAADTQVLTQGRLPAPQGHLGTAQLKVLAQSVSLKHLGTSHFAAAHW